MVTCCGTVIPKLHKLLYLNSTLQVSCQEADGEAVETLGAVRVPAERVGTVRVPYYDRPGKWR